MKRKRPLPPDTRPDWRDPNMPVLAQTKNGLEVWDHERFRRAIAGRLAICTEPHFTADPTYNLRKDRPRGQ